MTLLSLVSLYISHKRALGYRFRTEEAVLKSFCRTVSEDSAASIDAEVVLAFLNGNGPVTAYWVKKYHVLEGFYRFALARGFVSGVPLPQSIPRLSNEDYDCIRPGEHGLGADRDEASVCGSRTMGLLQHRASRLADSIFRTAGYITRKSGGVGGGKAAPSPRLHPNRISNIVCQQRLPDEAAHKQVPGSPVSSFECLLCSVTSHF
jgi:hypothetical protein